MKGTMEPVHQPQREADFGALECIAAARWSCRAFLKEPLPDNTIERILRVAQRMASWNNAQPWQTVIASGRATERFRTLMLRLAQEGTSRKPDLPFPREYRDVYMARRRACGFQLYDAVGVQRGDKEAYTRQTLRNFALFDAPHVAIVTTDEALGVYGAVDCGAYVSTFMLAAQAPDTLRTPTGGNRRVFGSGGKPDDPDWQQLRTEECEALCSVLLDAEHELTQQHVCILARELFGEDGLRSSLSIVEQDEAYDLVRRAMIEIELRAGRVPERGVGAPGLGRVRG